MNVVVQTVGTYKMTEWNPACTDGDGCEEHQRPPHNERNFLRTATIIGILLVVRTSPEDNVVKPEHIECCHTGHDSHDPFQRLTFNTRQRIAGGDNLILREEACKRRNTGDCQTADQETDVGNRHVLVQSAHILLEVAADDDNDCTRAEEEQCLEHGMGEEVEHGSHITEAAMMEILGTVERTVPAVIEADTERNKHIGNLRDGREGQTSLDVTLCTGYSCCIEGCERCNPRNPVKLFLRTELYVDRK